MPKYVITAPDGNDYEITAPEGASEQDALAHFQSQYSPDAERVNAPEEVAAEQPVAEHERTWYDPIRELGEGVSFGWADEAGSGIAAGVAKLMGDEKPYGQIYDEMQGIVSEQRKAYKDTHGAEALGLNILGGLASGGGGAVKVMGTQAIKNAPKLVKALALSGVGAAEGALAGAGTAEQGETLEGAAQGAKMGAILPVALKGLGKVAGGVTDAVTKRRVANDLVDEAGDFIPLNIAADEGSSIGNIYQKYIAPAFGGKPVREASRKVLKKAQAADKKAAQALQDTKTLEAITKDKSLRSLIKNDSMPLDISDEARAAITSADGQDANRLLSDAWSNGFNMVKQRDFDLNPDEFIKDVMSEFDSPADAKFASEIGGFLKQKLRQGFTPDKTAPAQAFSSKGMGSVKNPDVDLPTGKIDGKWLMQTRNDLRMEISKLRDEGATALEINAKSRAAKKIDDLITEQLGDGAGAFKQELTSWGNARSLADATKKAVVDSQGEASVKNVLQQALASKGRAAGEGTAPFQQQAQALQRQQAQELAQATVGKQVTGDALKDLGAKMPNLNPTPFHQAAATAGTAIPFALVNPMLTPLAPAATRLMATEGAQKLIAGQTGAQTYIQKLLSQLRASETPDRLISSLNRAAVANQGE